MQCRNVVIAIRKPVYRAYGFSTLPGTNKHIETGSTNGIKVDFKCWVNSSIETSDVKLNLSFRHSIIALQLNSEDIINKL